MILSGLEEVTEVYVAFKHYKTYAWGHLLTSFHYPRNNKHLLTSSNREIIHFCFYPLSCFQKNKPAEKYWLSMLKRKIKCYVQLQLSHNLSACSGTAEPVPLKQSSLPSSDSFLNSSYDPYPNSEHKYYGKFLLKIYPHFITMTEIHPSKIITGLKVIAFKKKKKTPQPKPTCFCFY